MMTGEIQFLENASPSFAGEKVGKVPPREAETSGRGFIKG